MASNDRSSFEIQLVILITDRHIFLLFLVLRIGGYTKTISAVKTGPPVSWRMHSYFEEKLDVRDFLQLMSSIQSIRFD